MRRILIAAALFIFASPALAQTVSVPPSITVSEGSPWSVPITRIGLKSTTLSFTFRTLDGTALAGQDYVARAGNQSIRKNATRYTVSGTTIDDTAHEAQESFVFEVTPKGQAPVRTTIVITDNDAAPPSTWVPGPLKIGGFARGKSDCRSDWPFKVSGPKADGTYDPVYLSIATGTVYPVITWGWSMAPIGPIWALDLGSGKAAYFRESCLEGVQASG